MMRIFLFGFLLSFVFISAHAHSIKWDSSKDYLTVGKSVDILEDKAGCFTIDQILSKEFVKKFTSSHKSIVNFGYTESIYWLRFSLKNSTSDSLILEIAHAILPITDIYYKDVNGDIKTIEGGYRIPLNKKKNINHFQVFSLPKGNTEFYVRILSNSHPLPIKIWEEKAYIIHTYKQRIGYGFYIGFMFFVILTNIFFFFSLRNKIYLFYAFVVFIYSCYASMVMDGFILYLFPKIDMMFLYVTIPTVGVAVQTIYCLMFLETKKYVPSIDKVVRYIAVYFLIYIFVRPFLPLLWVLPLNTIHALISFFIMGYVGIKVGSKGNRMGYYYASAYFIYFLLVFTEAIYIQTGYPSYLFGLSYVAWATLIEVFILSYLLSKRSEWERKDSEKEKMQTQQELFKTVQENERIVKEQNLILEKEVLKRTELVNRVNNELEVAIATKDKFFSIIAHDLKSPFNSLLGMSDLLVQEYNVYSEVEKKKYLKMINNGLVNTHNLLDNLLLWSQSQRDSIVFMPEKICLNELAKEAIAYLRQYAQSKSIVISNNIKKDSYVMADRNMFLTILRNLLTNAIKFTPNGGKVSVNLNENCMKTKEGFTAVSVKDNGLGIPIEQQGKLFNLTTNISTIGTGNESGTGLGLIICKEFIEKHGGNIWVDSELGKGTKFCISVPSAESYIA